MTTRMVGAGAAAALGFFQSLKLRTDKRVGSSLSCKEERTTFQFGVKRFFRAFYCDSSEVPFILAAYFSRKSCQVGSDSVVITICCTILNLKSSDTFTLIQSHVLCEVFSNVINSNTFFAPFVPKIFTVLLMKYTKYQPNFYFKKTITLLLNIPLLLF